MTDPFAPLLATLKTMELNDALSDEIMRSVVYIGEAMTHLATGPLLADGGAWQELMEKGAVDLVGARDMPGGWRPSFVEGWHVTSADARLILNISDGRCLRIEVDGTQTFIEERQRWHRDLIIRLRLTPEKADG